MITSIRPELWVWCIMDFGDPSTYGRIRISCSRLIFVYSNSSFTSPQVPQTQYPEGFQGNAIPIDGAAVARLCHERLTLAVEMDD